MNQTFRISLMFFLSLMLCGFSFRKKESPEIEMPRRIVAIVPIQKTFPGPLYLSTHPGFLSTVARMFKEKDLNLREKIDYDPKFVTDTLHRYLSNDVIRKGYSVFLPNQVEPFFEELQRSGKEFSLESLNQSLSANAFFLLTISEWDAETFDQDGSVKVSFDASLVDVATKKTVWSNRASGLKLTPSSRDFLYASYQKEILRNLCARILKDFPKQQWAS